jgi:alcohol dehydrogenase
MRAAVYEQFGQPLVVRSVPDPAPADDGVVIAVKATGLCRSDWHGWMGHDPDIRLPHVPGHELAGVVVAAGSLVRRWRAGDRVTVPFVCGCGACPQCASGNHQVCDRQSQPGFTHWGSFAEYVAIDRADTNLVALPEEMAYATAASLGCRFATSFRAVVDQGRVTAGQWVAVHGCGGVGLSAESSRTAAATSPALRALTTAAAPTCRSTRSAARRPAPARSGRSASAAGTCRWGSCSPSTASRRCPWTA